MSSLEKVLGIAVIILGLILFLKCCGEDQEETIIIPEKKGSFETEKPKYVDRDTTYIIKWYSDTIPDSIEIPNPVNDSLITQYLNVKDSLDRFKLYIEAIQIRRFSNIFEDSLLKLTINGEVQGQLLSIQPDYTIKEQLVKHNPKETVLRIFLGGEVETNENLDKNDYSLNLSLQNRKKAIYGFGYARQHGENYFKVRYDHPIFELKK